MFYLFYFFCWLFAIALGWLLTWLWVGSLFVFYGIITFVVALHQIGTLSTFRTIMCDDVVVVFFKNSFMARNFYI